MSLRIKKNLHILLSFWLLAYTMVAGAHFGHQHLYSKADPGLCTSQCEKPEHHNLKPNCQGFPVDLTMGVDAQPGIIQHHSPEFRDTLIFKAIPAIAAVYDSAHSRAPPKS